jgi:hypothetical protein
MEGLTVAEEIRSAHGAMDEERVKVALERWAPLSGQLQGETHASVRADVDAAVRWHTELEQQRAVDRDYVSACAALEQALDHDAGVSEVERLVAAVLRFEREVPKVLAARCTNRLEELRRAASRGHVMRLVLAVLGVGLVAGIVTFSWQEYGRRARITDWRARLDQAAAGDDPDAATALLATLDTTAVDVATDPTLGEARAKILAKATQEQQRASLFGASVAVLASATERSPSFKALLARAEALVRTEAERATIAEWRARREVFEDERQRFRDQELTGDIDRLVALHEEVRKAAAKGAPETLELGASCIELAERITKSGEASPSLRGRAEDIRTSTQALVKEALGRSDRASAAGATLDRLEALTDPGLVAGALRAFAQEYPDHPRAAEFVRASAREGLWRALEEWHALTHPWTRGLHVTEPKTAKERRAQLEAYLKAQPESPHRAKAEEGVRYLALAEKALGKGGLLGVDEVRELLASPLVADLLEVRDSQGRRYYILGEAAIESMGGDQVAVEFIFDPDLHTRKKAWSGARPKPRKSPQANWVDLAQRALVEVPTGWETVCLRLSEQVRANTEIDPVLAGLILRQLFACAEGITPLFAGELSERSKELMTLDLDVRWMDPDDKSAEPRRGRTRGVLERMGSLQPLVEQIETSLALGPRYRPVGVVGRRLVVSDPKASGSLVVFDQDVVRPRGIGKVERGVVTPSPAEPPPAAGSLVFVTE